jgi:ribose-phosphate pyrophosphokinase
LFAGKAMQRLREHPSITEVLTTDTVPQNGRGDWDRFTVRSVAPLFAEAISRIHGGESISSMFDGVDPTHGPPQPQLPFATA